ncbi:MAG: hypothetical protein DRQ88_05165 [Epsilonproteobacteria bacterium]|nr:MAG: hypothetical protein DRQ89_04590 [Campylobacterota bacterium]RLA66818.1 MAG: hypothetical protein DRQ88_05165 [Campylobacterota bacterium]
MKNILILGLDSAEYLFTLGRLIKSMPDQKISLLILDKEINAAGLIPGVDEIYTIESNKICGHLKNELFSDALAINLLSESLAKVEQKTWDKIINFGTTEFGRYLSSYLCLKHPESSFIGYRYDRAGELIPIDPWHTLSYALRDYKFYPLNELEVSHLSLETTLQLSSIAKNEEQGDIKVGIQIPRFTDDKNLSFKTLIEFIDILKTDLNYFPILLFDPADSNDEYAGKINRYFDNELEIISTNYLNLTKVLPLLDSLITIKSNLKNLAQQMGIPVIEIICGEEQLGVTWAPGERDITVISMDRIKGEDLYNVLTQQFELIDPELKIYHSQQDLIGARPIQLIGDRILSRDISISMSRYLIGKLYLNISESKILDEMILTPVEYLNEWQLQEKKFLAEVSRIILNSLRLLKQISESEQKINEFVESIDELISLGKSNSLVSIPILLFKYQIDLIPSKTELESIEKLIFNLKEGVQIVITVLKDLENAIWNKKKRIIIEKSIKNKTLTL